MELSRKLALLADAAKYDASCASSGAAGRQSSASGGLGSTTGSGICHSYAPDGRCISLLKILLTNFCVYDCHYCVNWRSSDVRRARFTTGEVVPDIRVVAPAGCAGAVWRFPAIEVLVGVPVIVVVGPWTIWT